MTKVADVEIYQKATRTCEVCHAVGVVNIVGSLAGPSSHAVCQSCFDCGAEPWINMVYLAASEVGDWIDPIIEVSILKSGKTRSDFDRAVEDLKRQFIADCARSEHLEKP